MSFETPDRLGPEKHIELYDPVAGLKAILVVDNTAAGPAVGGARMASDVSAQECFRLARAMTFKNAAAGCRTAAPRRSSLPIRDAGGDEGGSHPRLCARDRRARGLHPWPRHGDRRSSDGVGAR